LVRDGAASQLSDGAVLRAGDEIRVGADGFVALLLGDSRVRLAAGADAGSRPSNGRGSRSTSSPGGPGTG